MDSNSGIILPQEAHVSELFTDITTVACKQYNILCRAKRYGKWWLLKGLKPAYREQEIYRTLLRKEFDILISLQHPNIVTATGFEDVPGLGHCIVMEWIDGRTLADFISEHPEGGEKDDSLRASLRDIVFQLLDALEYIHAKQIVHRDLKPSNIMITYNGNHAKLIDFGLSDADSYAILKQPAGTRRYTAPEQAHSRQADIRNDIYSLGCILEDMRLGKGYDAIVAKCKAPIQERYQHVEEVRRDFVAHSSAKARPVKHLATLSLIAILLIGGVGYTLLYNYKGEADNLYNNNGHKEPLAVENTVEQKGDTAKKALPLASAVSTPTASPTTPSSDKSNRANQANRGDKAPIDVIVEKGKQQIDLMWKAAGIDQQQDLVEKSQRFYQFIDDCNKFITDTYPNAHKPTLDAKGKDAVTNTLSSYMTEKYVKPTLEEIQREGERLGDQQQ